jgi:UDP-glucose 4-epimerase
VAPLTTYAQSKIAAEDGLRQINGDMNITALRFATACGVSDRLRLDLVLNDFVAAALAQGRIDVLSDGSPWRPLIDVADMARAIDWAIHRPPSHAHRFLVVNAGASANNYRVKQIADAVAAAVPGTTLNINQAAPVDSRSYQVDFRLFERLAPDHVPRVKLSDSIAGVVTALSARQNEVDRFRSHDFVRLSVLRRHVESQRLSRRLEWSCQ